MPPRPTSVASLWHQLRRGGVPLLLILTVVVGVFRFVLFDYRDREMEEARGIGSGPIEPIPDIHITGYEAVRLKSYAIRLTPAGRDVYVQSQLLLDFAFPVVYGLWLAVAMAAAFGRTGPAFPTFRYVLIFPAAAILFDWAENVAIIVLFKGFPDSFSDDLAQLASVLTQLKWAMVLACFAAVVVGVVTSVRYTSSMKRRSPPAR